MHFWTHFDQPADPVELNSISKDHQNCADHGVVVVSLFCIEEVDEDENGDYREDKNINFVFVFGPEEFLLGEVFDDSWLGGYVQVEWKEEGDPNLN